MISASINIRMTAPSVLATETELFQVTYDIRQTLVQAGLTAQGCHPFGREHRERDPPVVLFGGRTWEVHVWESGINTNQIIKSIDTTNVDDIQFDDLTGTELEGKLTIEHSGGKLQMRALEPWDKIDSGRSAADKEVRTITYGLFSSQSTYYKFGVDRFTAVEGNKWYMNTVGMVKGKTLKGTVGAWSTP